jgi:hypothetical protein
VVAIRTETIVPPEVLNGKPKESERGRSYLYGGVALLGIWVSVTLLSIFSPDLVTGSEQDHFSLALVVGVLAGLAATRSVVKALSQFGRASRPAWIAYVAAVVVIWAGVALASILLLVNVTGADPTRFPVAAVVAPIAGAILTGLTTELFAAARR